MSQENFPKDVKLIKELYDKLEWLTFEADDTDFSAEQVNAILTLLDTMDPEGDFDIEGLGMAAREARRAEKGSEVVLEEEEPLDVEAAFLRFKKRYNITEAEMSHKVWEDNIRISKDDLELSDEISFDSEEFRKKLAEFRSREAAKATTASASDADNSESGDSENDTSTRGASAGPNAEAAHHDASVDTDAANGGAVVNSDLNAEHRKSRKYHKNVFFKVAAALVVVVAAFTALNVGTKAVSQKSFFEIVRDGVNGMRYTVTGNEVESIPEGMWESEEVVKTYYDSWEEMEAAVGVELLKPTYVPDGLALNRIYTEKANSNTLCQAIFGLDEELSISLHVYEGDYYDALAHSSEDWKRIKTPSENVNNAEFYEGDGGFQASFYGEKIVVFVIYDELEELVKIVNSIN